MPETPDVAAFIEKWEQTGAAERANYQIFLIELCELLGVDRPEGAKPDASQNAYVFDHPVLYNDGFDHTSTNWIDLYKRGCFVLEAKQGSDRAKASSDGLNLPKAGRKGTAVRGTRGWDSAMLEAKGQAERYARALPASDGWPPFLVVVDVGHSIELYADFTRSGKTYVAFPDARTHRLALRDLALDEIRERLRLVWTEPLALDPSRRTAKVTREVADRLARLAKSLEASGHQPEPVAQFLMRCLFTMFAEDVELIPRQGFSDLLKSRVGKVETFPAMVGSLWRAMDTGDFHPILEKKLPRFNGQLFASAEAPPLSEDQLKLLIDAASADWRDVEPAIFGTLLERALDPVERHKLGAHYTPRAYVERLVLPTIVEPLRDEWADAQAAALLRQNEGKPAEARDEVRAFLRKLCDTIVLDPACGTGNFLYVTLEHMKRLEGEVRDALIGLGEEQAVFEGTGLTVDPHQFLGIEINPRAAAIAELVLWIGHLQWHFRTVGKTMPAEPILHAYKNIECRDAILAYDRKEPVLDAHLRPVTRWDGRTTKPHPVTGEEVPDEDARTMIFRYINPRKADWPEADYVIGNPPFIGNWKMRDLLGDGYSQAVRETYNDLTDSIDFVMYWWDKAGELASRGRLKRFGFITTNSLKQKFNRTVLEKYALSKKPVSLLFAVPDHPWVDSKDGAAVRISMTVAESGDREGLVQKVISETSGSGDELDVRLSKSFGKIYPDLSVGANLDAARPLRASDKISCPGVKLHGAGFIVTYDEAIQLGLGRTDGVEKIVKKYRNGRDLTQSPRGVMVIDLFGRDSESIRVEYPEIYQRVLERVKPERDHNNRLEYKNSWWIFGEPRRTFRPALHSLKRFISTVETSKHRFFVFLEEDFRADNTLIVIALEDAYFLGVLSAKIHLTWALAAGGRLGVGNDPRYNKTRCFEPFPFPDCDESKKSRIRDLAESLDAHRKRQQALHPTLTMTDMYNVLEKLRSGEALTAKEKVVHEQGLVSVLKQIHDDLDAAVFDAYGWPRDLSDEAILERLVALNAERAAEEAKGIIRWLRPEFQDPKGKSAAPVQSTLAIVDDEPEPTPEKGKAKPKEKKTPWPATLAEQVQAVRTALAAKPGGITVEALAKTFSKANRARLTEVLDTLESLGHARSLGDGRYARA